MIQFLKIVKRKKKGEKMNYLLLPPHLRDGLRRYIEYGICPGSFLQAVICNDFEDIMLRGDPISLGALQSIARFMSDVPASIKGSKMAMRAWIKLNQENRGKEKDANSTE
jgi:hypothetical protein